MDVSNIIGAAVVVTQQTSQQINPQQDQASATGATVGDGPSAQQQVAGTQNTAHGAAQNNSENASSNDDAKGSDNDKDNSSAAAAATPSNGVGANLNITA